MLTPEIYFHFFQKKKNWSTSAWVLLVIFGNNMFYDKSNETILCCGFF
jgi:hypothetical protein